MADRRRLALAVVVTIALFLTIQFGALALAEPFEVADRQVVEDPEDPGSSVIFILAILVATAVMLAGFRFNAELMIRGVLILVSGSLAWIVFRDVLPAIMVGPLHAPAAIGTLGVVAGLALYPEWYVIDIAGIVMGAGAAGLFGISLGIFPVMLFLVALAIYDAISVYRTEHMLSLAEGVMDLRVPVVLIVPVTAGYSVFEDDPDIPDAASAEDDDPERDAFFIGLGDAVIPTILVVSVAVFGAGDPFAIPVVTLTGPALGAIVGTILGLTTLLYFVHRGRAHAGLPLLNGGAILGYLAVALAGGVPLREAIGL
ncbi:MAG: presenilin family intramembrane aspartyl protease PSH [Natrialbaceae archaeon]|nr:presenilin family intramembrane aspartyl protease PSH [Natrialbaceae archaeon]